MPKPKRRLVGLEHAPAKPVRKRTPQEHHQRVATKIKTRLAPKTNRIKYIPAFRRREAPHLMLRTCCSSTAVAAAASASGGRAIASPTCVQILPERNHPVFTAFGSHMPPRYTGRASH